MAETRPLVYVRYRDHVLYQRCNPESLSPQTREAVGWLIYDSPDYVILCWDRDAEPPTLKGGDPKASGMVILRSDIVEIKKLLSDIFSSQSSTASRIKIAKANGLYCEEGT